MYPQAPTVYVLNFLKTRLVPTRLEQFHEMMNIMHSTIVVKVLC